MGTKKDEKTVARAEETETKLDNISGGNGDVGGKSSINRNQQERINRAGSPQPSVFNCGESTIGGTISQLIDDYENQLALKHENIKRLNEEIARESSEIERLNYRVKEFKALLNELNNQPEST